MQIPDLINGMFEMLGGVAIMASILKLVKEKKVRGVHWLQAAFFASWGWWNLYYYPYLDQWASFTGGVFLMLTNSVWLWQMVYYNRKEKRDVKLRIK